MENKSLMQIINETETKIVEALNESHLAPEVLELIVRNVMLSIHNAAMAQTEGNVEDPIKEE